MSFSFNKTSLDTKTSKRKRKSKRPNIPALLHRMQNEREDDDITTMENGNNADGFVSNNSGINLLTQNHDFPIGDVNFRRLNEDIVPVSRYANSLSTFISDSIHSEIDAS